MPYPVRAIRAAQPPPIEADHRVVHSGAPPFYPTELPEVQIVKPPLAGIAAPHGTA